MKRCVTWCALGSAPGEQRSYAPGFMISLSFCLSGAREREPILDPSRHHLPANAHQPPTLGLSGVSPSTSVCQALPKRFAGDQGQIFQVEDVPKQGQEEKDLLIRSASGKILSIPYRVLLSYLALASPKS